MDANLKKVLLNVVYYSLIGIMVTFVVFFVISLGSASMALWEKVSLYILIGLLVSVVIYDIVCTCIKSQKYIAGFVLYGITMMVIILTLVIMAINATNGRLLLDISEKFFRLILIAYIINALAVLIYCTGEKLIINITDRIKK